MVNPGEGSAIARSPYLKIDIPTRADLCRLRRIYLPSEQKGADAVFEILELAGYDLRIGSLGI